MAPSAAGGPPTGPKDWTSPTAPTGELPGATRNPDGSDATNAAPSLSEAVATIKADDFAKIASTPCARNGLLVGIAAGAGAGGLRFSLRGNARNASNLAVGFFLLGSVASYEYCQFRRRKERSTLKREIEVVAAQKHEKVMEQRAAQQLRLEEERRKLEEEQRRQKEEQKGWRWAKFW